MSMISASSSSTPLLQPPHQQRTDPFTLSLMANTSFGVFLQQQLFQHNMPHQSLPSLRDGTSSSSSNSEHPLVIQENQQQQHQNGTSQELLLPMAVQQQLLEKMVRELFMNNSGNGIDPALFGSNANSFLMAATLLRQQMANNVHYGQFVLQQQRHLMNPMAMEWASSMVSNNTSNTPQERGAVAAASGAPSVIECCPIKNAENYRHQQHLESISRNKLGRSYNPGRPLGMLDRQKILELYQKGLKISHIAKVIGVTHSCVSKIMTRYRRTGSIHPRSAQLLNGRRQQQHPQHCPPLNPLAITSNSAVIGMGELPGGISDSGLPSAFRRMQPATNNNIGQRATIMSGNETEATISAESTHSESSEADMMEEKHYLVKRLLED